MNRSAAALGAAFVLAQWGCTPDDSAPAPDTGAEESGSASGTEESGSSEETGLTETETETSSGRPNFGDADRKSTMFGTMRDPEGNTIASLPIALCDSYGCKGGQTEADGTFTIENNLSGAYAFLITGEEAAVGDRAFTLVALELEGTRDREYDAVALSYTHSAPMPPTPEELEVAPGLFVTVQASDIEADFTVPHELEDISGLLAAPEHRMETDGLPPIHAMWHLAPYKAWAPGGLPLRIRNDFDLPADETYEVWEVGLRPAQLEVSRPRLRRGRVPRRRGLAPGRADHGRAHRPGVSRRAVGWVVARSSERVVVDADGIEVSISSPTKVLFPDAGYTKLDLVRYYLAIAPGALAASGGRPHQLVRFPKGIAEDHFYQKRAPKGRPAFVDTVVLKFPSGRTAEEVVPNNAATLAWMANLGCLELHPHAVRATDLLHPDELRVDLDPTPGVEWGDLVAVAQEVRVALRDYNLVGWAKTSGSRGVHILVRIEPRWEFSEVRRAALALAREVERRIPKLATSAWWKEERHGVFIDYNQNAKDRTTAGAYSVRPRPDARVSAPLSWDELVTCDPAAFTLRTMPDRFAEVGHLHDGIEDAVGSLEPLLELAAEQEAQGHRDAPWPPHHPKGADEPNRAPPSRTKGATKTARRKAANPLIEVARADREADAREELERWKERHAEITSYLEPSDILVDRMRGRYKTWTRVRINLKNVPPEKRPGPDDADDP